MQSFRTIFRILRDSILKGQSPTCFALHHEEIQIIQCALRLRRHRRHPQTGKLKNEGRRTCVFPLAHVIDRVECVCCGAVLTRNFLSHFFERHILIGERIPNCVPHARRQVCKGRIPAGVHAEHDMIYEHADETFQIRSIPAGKRRSDNDICFSIAIHIT